MAWQNVGVAHLLGGRLDDAGAAFHRALALDPAFALPHVGLAQRALASGDHAEVARRVAEARARGFPDDALDALVRGAQSALARVEGG